MCEDCVEAESAMSNVTDIVLLTPLGEGAAIEKLNSWLVAQKDPGMPLVQVNSYASTTKCMQADVYVLAVNYLDDGLFLQEFRAAPWRTPQHVQLLFQRECDEEFSMHRPNRLSP